jgi:PHS family inorganic phosphate transporter-like MFS transporter
MLQEGHQPTASSASSAIDAAMLTPLGLQRFETNHNPYLDIQERELAKHRVLLQETDDRPFGWFHIKTCMIAGVGFFTDAYDIFVINLVVNMLGFIYFQDNNNTVPPSLDLGIKVAVVAGTLCGQLLFGLAGDKFGRKKIYGLELAIIIFCTVASVFAGNGAHGVTVSMTLIFWRVLLGFGIGGDYPLSATITSEFSSPKKRGAMVGAVFAMQGIGILLASLVVLVFLAIFKPWIDEDITMLDPVWRLSIAFGIIPAIISIYFRLTIPETPRYRMEKAIREAKRLHALSEAQGDLEGAERLLAEHEQEEVVQKASWSDFTHHFGQWRHFKVLLACSVCWFCLDVGFYGVNLNNSVILKAIGFASSGTPYEQLFKNATGNVLIALVGTMPGYWVTVFTVDHIGRKPIQLIGFAVVGVIFLLLGILYRIILDASVVLFVIMFTVAMFFKNFGPNATTFIYPTEVFPTRYRSTAHGISAASGKLGAVVAQVGFSSLKDIGGKNAFVDKLLIIFAIFMGIGFLFTLLLPETKQRSLEEINQDFEDDDVLKAQRAQRRKLKEALKAEQADAVHAQQ